jgi:acetyl-CoA carboxylase biotin carboxyl carrier protein
MDFKQIQELIKLVNKSNIGEVSIEENGQKLTIKQKKDPAPVYAAAPMVSAPVAAPAAVSAASAPATPAPAKSAEAPLNESKLVTIKSPMIGTFYRQPSPDKPAFVEVGDTVEAGTPVCIIEAMKLFNKIESEVRGTIVKVLVEDRSPVDYDQPLFQVDPS